MADVVKIDFHTKGPVPVGQVLDGARDLDEVLVIGWDKDGEIGAGSSTGDVAEILHLIERFKFKLLAGEFGE